ncbi:jg16580 [Pararge aegeria aegeria]|uniref:Jg16580 protein n=1 Tax=Pararge aegeria aegeria TaxID=348720 RepID=A0A8S4R9Q7_9NEOP|nr:jg16580 [Pararge aegeria aegeria]
MVQEVHSACQMAVPSHWTAAFRGSFRLGSCKIMEHNPPPVQNLTTVFSFKSKLKKIVTYSDKKKDDCKRIGISDILEPRHCDSAASTGRTIITPGKG